jgi:Ca2+/Na+ antiporter
VVLIFWAKTRRRELALRSEQRTDVGFLLVATLWAFSIPIRQQLSLLDLAVLGALFVAYIIRAAREEVEEPELIGAAAALGAMPQRPPRITTVLSVPVLGGEHPPREEPLSETRPASASETPRNSSAYWTSTAARSLTMTTSKNAWFQSAGRSNRSSG